MKIILMGTSSWVIPVFKRAASEHDIMAVFTRAPKPAGRNKKLTKSPVHEWAESSNIPVFTNINQLSDENLSHFDIDYIIVASYGVILKQNVLDFAPCVNIHPSLLPKYRGPSPMLSAIYNGDLESGICLMQISAEIDSGDIFMCKKFEIGIDDTEFDVEEKVGVMASDMLSEYLAAPAKYPAHAQIGTPTFTHKFTSNDEIIDWSRSAFDIHNQIRAIGGRTKINGIDVKIIKTKLSKEVNDLPVSGLEILQIQPAGKKPMDWKSFLNGQRGKIEF